MGTSRHFNCLPKVAKMVCRGSKHHPIQGQHKLRKRLRRMPLFSSVNHFIHLDYRLLINHISSWNYQAVQIIEYSRKAQIQSQEEVIQLVQLILRHRISIGLCNWDRFILIYKLMFPPDLLHRKLHLLILQVFLICMQTSADYLSVPFCTISLQFCKQSD